MGPFEIFWREVASGGSYLAHLGKLAATTSLIFAIKWRLGLKGRGSTPWIFSFHIKLVRRRRKK